MTDRISRSAFLRRAAAGGSILTVPGLLAACGGGGKSAATTAAAATSASQTLPKTITFSNWPLYIDINEKKKTHPSLVQFQAAHPGTKVRYIEDINDNDSFFGKIEGPLSQGQSVGRDLVVMTDSSGLPQRMIQLGWLEKWDKSAMPNFKNLIPAQQHPAWDPNREYSLPWQSGLTGIGYDPKQGRLRDRLGRQAAHRPEAQGQGDAPHRAVGHDGSRHARERGRPGERDQEDVGRRGEADQGRGRRRARSASSRATTTRRCWPRATSGRASPGRATWCSSRPTIRA